MNKFRDNMGEKKSITGLTRFNERRPGDRECHTKGVANL